MAKLVRFGIFGSLLGGLVCMAEIDSRKQTVMTSHHSKLLLDSFSHREKVHKDNDDNDDNDDDDDTHPG